MAIMIGSKNDITIAHDNDSSTVRPGSDGAATAWRTAV